MGKERTLKEVGVGEVFKVAGIEFIKFYDEGGNTVAVAKDILYNAEFGNNNNFAKSKVLKGIKMKVLSNIKKEVGEDNIVEHEVDLLSLDGSDKWGKVKTKISLPTFDFYRKNVKIFDKYKGNKWWWLSTPDTTAEHYNDNWVTCVSPNGYIDISSSNFNYYGVRPFCILKSCIFQS